MEIANWQLQAAKDALKKDSRCVFNWHKKDQITPMGINMRSIVACEQGGLFKGAKTVEPSFVVCLNYDYTDWKLHSPLDPSAQKLQAKWASNCRRINVIQLKKLCGTLSCWVSTPLKSPAICCTRIGFSRICRPRSYVFSTVTWIYLW